MISVIVPVYNVEKTIKRCLESIVNQTYSNLEIILVDDCSTDKSVDEILKFDDSRIKLIKQTKNYGVSVSRNKGIVTAKGDFIGFVDCDDFIDLNFYEVLVNSLKQNDTDICMSDTNMIGKFRKTYKQHKDSAVITKFEDKMDFLIHGGCCDKLFRAKIIKDNNILFPEKLMWEDNLFIVKAMFFSKSISFTNKTSYNYVFNESSQTNSALKTQKRVDDNLAIVKKIVEFCGEQRFTKEQFNAVMRFLFKFLITKRSLKNQKYYDGITKIIDRKTINKYNILRNIKEFVFQRKQVKENIMRIRVFKIPIFYYKMKKH